MSREQELHKIAILLHDISEYFKQIRSSLVDIRIIIRKIQKELGKGGD